MKNALNLPLCCGLCGLIGLAIPTGLLVLPGRLQAQAQTPTAGDTATYALRPVWKAGEVARYQLTVHRTTDGKKRYDLDVLDSLFRITLLQTIREVRPDGSLVVEDSTEEADGKFDGIDMELTNAIPKITLTRDKAGEATVKAEGGVDLVREPIAQLFRLTSRMQRGFTPPAPVRVGEPWKFTWQDTGLIEGRTDGKGILVGPGTWKGQPTLKVKVEYDSKVKATDPRTNNKLDVAFHFTGAADMDAKTFQIVQLTGNGEEHLPDNETAKTEVTLTRLPSKSEAKKTTANTGDTARKKNAEGQTAKETN